MNLKADVSGLSTVGLAIWSFFASSPTEFISIGIAVITGGFACYHYYQSGALKRVQRKQLEQGQNPEK